MAAGRFGRATSAAQIEGVDRLLGSVCAGVFGLGTDIRRRIDDSSCPEVVTGETSSATISTSIGRRYDGRGTESKPAQSRIGAVNLLSPDDVLPAIVRVMYIRRCVIVCEESRMSDLKVYDAQSA